MGRLFWKIFLIIWLGQLVVAWGVGGALLLFETRYSSNILPHTSVSDSQAPSLDGPIPAIIATLEQHGIDGIKQRFQPNADFPVYIVDQSGRDFLGRKVPNNIQQQGINASTFPRVTYHGQHYQLLPFLMQQPERVQSNTSNMIPTVPHTAVPTGNTPLRWQPMALATLLSLVYAALLAWYLVVPVRNLKAAFAKAANGELDVRLSVAMGKRRDDLADLGRDFDQMAGRLHALLESQHRLLHDISHELRSPLTRLQVAVGLLRQQPAKLESSLTRIEQESMRIDSLIGELLTLSRLGADDNPLVTEPVPIDELLADIVADANFEAEAQHKRVQLVGQSNVTLPADLKLLARAIENVVRNAVKYTQENSLVSVEVEKHRQTLMISVLDEGPGVPDADLKLIFEPFFRCYSPAQQRSGYGLGLAITWQIIHKHGGDIRAENRVTGGLRVIMSFVVA